MNGNLDLPGLECEKGEEQMGSRPGTISSQVCKTTRAAREVRKLIARGNETSESDRDNGAEIANENDEG